MDPSLQKTIIAPPGRPYLEFCRAHLLGGGELVDPFALELPDDRLLAACVDRRKIEEELPQVTDRRRQGVGQSWRQPMITIVLAPRGRGKTTLLRKTALEIPPGDVLVVPIPLNRIVGRLFAAGSERYEAEDRLLSAVLRCIFDRFCEVLRDPQQRSRYLLGRRENREWMIRLQRLYQQLPSLQPEILDDFELMTWLQASPPTRHLADPIRPARQLRELIGLVTAPPSPFYGDEPAFQYNCVRVFIDSGDDLSQNDVNWLIRELCWLHDQLPPKLQLALLLDTAWRAQAVQGVWEVGGGMALYELPCWEAEDLTEMLRLRIATWREDRYAQEDWAQVLLCKSLAPAAQRAFIPKIVAGAEDAAKAARGERDAPLHALWLMRRLVAELAQREQDGEPPLELEPLQAHIQNYINLCTGKEEMR